MQIENQRLRDVVAIVTGGGSGFGEAICRLFADHGAKLVVADLNAENGRRIANALSSEGHSALFVQTDVSQGSAMQALADATIQQYDRIDVVINNAGISHANQPMLQVSEFEFDRIFQVNVKSIYHSALSFVPVFRRQGYGCFINIGSTAAVRPRPGLTWYNGSKGAVTMLTKSMAVELALDKIRVNSINPAIADTPLLTTFMGTPDSEESRARFIASIPLGRLTRPVDVANAALFLADPASDFITGVCLEVDGGRCI